MSVNIPLIIFASLSFRTNSSAFLPFSKNSSYSPSLPLHVAEPQCSTHRPHSFPVTSYCADDVIPDCQLGIWSSCFIFHSALPTCILKLFLNVQSSSKIYYDHNQTISCLHQFLFISHISINQIALLLAIFMCLKPNTMESAMTFSHNSLCQEYIGICKFIHIWVFFIISISTFLVLYILG